MEDRNGNILLAIILIILMVVAIVIVIINPNKLEETVQPTQNIIEKEEKVVPNTNKQNEEEQQYSMEQGGTFCKIGNKITFYEEKDKSIYLYNLENNEIKKLTTIDYIFNKMYFDGENVYILPDFHSSKGIYKLNLEGEINKIYEGSSLQLHITKNEIYFINQIGYDQFNKNPQGTICVMKKDGSELKEIAQNAKNYFYVQNDKIYYTTQDRKLNVVNKDGTNLENLEEGRKFVTFMSEKYLLYIDYANQEAEHILNIETKEDKIIGYYATTKQFQGKKYINIRKRLDDGSIEQDYTLFELKEDGSITEIGKIFNSEVELKYIANNKAYLYTNQEGIDVISLENAQLENSENYKNCDYFLGGFGYKIDNSDLNSIKIEKVEL